MFFVFIDQKGSFQALMRSYDFVVIGGGIVGLTIARELSRRKAGSICLLEKEPEFGLHASGRNSGVLHAGIYYSPDSLKAKFCSRGAKAMMAYADQHGIPMQRIGKVIVAATAEDVPTVRKLYDRSLANGIRVELVDEARLREIEPEAKTCEIALYSPDTAIIDSKATLKSIAKEVLSSGVTVIKNSGALRISDRNIQIQSGAIAFGHLINAAGLHADRVAHAMGTGERYSILPFKGIYRKLRSELASRFRGLIYPAPDLSVPFLGVHTVKTTTGEVMAGPTAIPAFGRENYGILSGIDGNSFRIGLDLAALFLKNTGGFRKMMWQEVARYDARNFLKAVQALVPFLRQEDLLGVGKIGLRAQLFDRKEKKLVMDFVIEDGPYSTHILNAISPAFTSSMVFAEVVADRVLARR
jgi:L-2-hydroxyglutarate oxidase LhgO